MVKNISRQGWATLAIFVLLALVPPVAHAFDNAFLITMFNRAVIYAVAAVGLDLIIGFGGMVSFGHAAFFGIGAYTAGILGTHAFDGSDFIFGWTGSNDAFVVWPLAMLVAAFFGLIIGLISLRTSGVYFIMITLAFAQLFYFFFVSLSQYGGADGLSLWDRNVIPGLDLYDRDTFYYLCFAILLAVWFLLSRLVGSRFGRVVIGCKQNERRMRALGYDPLLYKLTAFCISAAIGGLAGALIANHSEFVSPGLLHWSRSGELMVIVILGGLGTLVGPIYGALALFLMEESLVSFTEHWQVILGPVLILVVVFFRGGIVGFLSGAGKTTVKSGGDHG
ncbi:branched-chain amino acid ABC transporter permease [Thalassospira mesophila]|uniref:branched-chain amino acid ABC transporter permease n=1 Tax=Thalassospira mesophila TaxID=1293891 RepID=UPI000A1F7168|nr:branched-chain amino acid ABC transporter permease [Thalassospira mesophila]